MNLLQMYNEMSALKKRGSHFVLNEEGAQIVEYGLIIAVVSIALVIALSQIATGAGPFGAFVAGVTACLTTHTCV